VRSNDGRQTKADGSGRRPLLRQQVLPCVLGIALLLVLACGFWPYTVDDAYITFRYSRNLAAGLGPVFNPGERVEGYTSLLWMLGGAGASALGLDLELVAKVAGLACAAATLVVVVRWVARSYPDRPLAPWVTAGFLGLSADLALNSVAGLETTFFALLLLLAVTRAASEEHKVEIPWSSLWFALAALTRPEGLALFAAHWLYQALVSREPPARLVARLLPFLGLVVPHLLWRRAYYGEWLPATYYAKWSPLGTRLSQGLGYWFDYLVANGFLFVIAIWPGLWSANRRLRYWMWMGVVAWAVVIWEGGDWMPGHRFLVISLPLWCAVAGVVFGERSRRQGRLPVVPIIAVVVYAVLILGRLGPLRHYAQVRAAGYEAAHRPLAEWLEGRLGPQDSVALMDVGVVGYHTHLRVIDISGLTEATIARAPGGFLDKVYDPAYVLDQSPAALVFVDTDGDGETNYPIETRIAAHEDFQRYYALGRSWVHYRDPQLGDYVLLAYTRRD